MPLVTISLTEFKSIQGVDEIQIVKNPRTDKLFAVDSKGQKYKCQGDLDTGTRVSFLHDTNSTFDEGCFINPSETNVLAYL